MCYKCENTPSFTNFIISEKRINLCDGLNLIVTVACFVSNRQEAKQREDRVRGNEIYSKHSSWHGSNNQADASCNAQKVFFNYHSCFTTWNSFSAVIYSRLLCSQHALSVSYFRSFLFRLFCLVISLLTSRMDVLLYVVTLAVQFNLYSIFFCTDLNMFVLIKHCFNRYSEENR